MSDAPIDRDFCLVPVTNPKRAGAPPALLFATIDKCTSYSELLYMRHANKKPVIVVLCPRGTMLGDFMYAQLHEDGSFPDDLLSKVLEEFTATEQLDDGTADRQWRLGCTVFNTHYSTLQMVKLDFLTQPDKAAEYAESLTEALDLQQALLDMVTPPCSQKHAYMYDFATLLGDGLALAMGLVPCNFYDEHYHTLLEMAEELSEDELCNEDLYLRIANWLKEHKNLKRRMRFGGIHPSYMMPPGMYAWLPGKHTPTPVSEVTSPFQATDDFHEPWSLRIYGPTNRPEDQHWSWV